MHTDTTTRHSPGLHTLFSIWEHVFRARVRAHDPAYAALHTATPAVDARQYTCRMPDAPPCTGRSARPAPAARHTPASPPDCDRHTHRIAEAWLDTQVDLYRDLVEMLSACSPQRIHIHAVTTFLHSQLEPPASSVRVSFDGCVNLPVHGPYRIVVSGLDAVKFADLWFLLGYTRFFVCRHTPWYAHEAEALLTRLENEFYPIQTVFAVDTPRTSHRENTEEETVYEDPLCVVVTA